LVLLRSVGVYDAYRDKVVSVFVRFRAPLQQIPKLASCWRGWR
jgi:hypothetical protein